MLPILEIRFRGKLRSEVAVLLISSVLFFGGCLPRILEIACRNSVRQGGRDPSTIPVENSATVQYPRETTSPTERVRMLENRLH